ncbi:hypothetical protein B0T16DRAFT_454854 [Cercophora newfieldiana]|uniref:F-box domain-containing protein n=1 Tax=Cercophora newfieldiana TaxID=92897 RepID=A0AA40CX75_9PEZI|nr:hypothetical protein B0T16DRAFT_454854 [Cercophora newfieldiana]
MDSRPPATIASLPPELLSHIFGHFASAPPSDTRLNDQPMLDMFKNSDTPLKNTSLVSKQWRAVVLPVLFRHVIWTFDRWDLLLVEPSQSKDPVDGLPFLNFLRQHDLGRYVDSLTMVIGNSMKGITRRAELGRILDLAGSNSSASSSSSSSSGIRDGNGTHDAKIEPFLSASRHPQIVNRAATYNEDNNWVWDMLFGLMDPRRITIMASPQMLASLISRMLFLGDAWSFSRDLLHILSLSRDSRSAGAAASKPQIAPSPSPSEAANGLTSPPPTTSTKSKRIGPPPSTLFTIRPWTHLLVNEGSSTRVYKTYEFYLRRPPSILGALLGCEEAPNDTPLIPSTLKSMSYIAIFPLSSHFQSLVTFLPRLERLYIQLVPQNNILHDPEEMRNIQRSDLWMERNTCYGLVMRNLLTNHFDFGDDNISESEDDERPHGSESNWRHLRVFESGDAADKEAWDMAVQYVRTSGADWHVESDGVFVRGPEQPTLAGASDGAGIMGTLGGSQSGDIEGDAAALEIFQGKLERLAFNGTDNLPYSPLALAMEDNLVQNLPWWGAGYDNGYHIAFPHPLEIGDDWPMDDMQDDETGAHRAPAYLEPEWTSPY